MTEEDKWTLITQLATALQERGRQVEKLHAEVSRLSEMINNGESEWLEKLAMVERLEAENARLRTAVGRTGAVLGEAPRALEQKP